MTIDEIFAALPEEVAQDVHEYLVIDPVTRTIAVPEAESVFGVEEDENSERKYFICPRYVGDNLDLAACFLSIKYRNANGEKDEYLVEDTAVNGEYVTFSWLISEKVVKYKGVVQFRFYADPSTSKAWGTTLAQGTSLEGLEPDTDTVEEETSDVVTQLRAMVTQQTGNVEAVGAAQVAAVKAQGTASTQEAVEAIQAQGAATNASIPAEYTELEATVDRLTRDRAAAIVCEAEGTAIQVQDASNDPLQGLRIFGKSTQDGTPTPDSPVEIVSTPAPVVTVCGKNLLPPKANALVYAGMTYTPQADGTLRVSGATPAGEDSTCYLVTKDAPITLPPGEYVLGGVPGASEKTYRLLAYTTDWTFLAETTPGRETFTLEKVADLFVYLWVYRGMTVDMVVSPQIERGTVATEYEPYTTQALAITTPDSLPGIPVASGGNYTDANGQQWICDEVDLARGVYVQRVGIATLDASTDEYWYTIQATGGTIFGIAISDAIAAGSSKKVYCTHFAASVNDTYNKTGNACYFYDKTLRICHMSIDTLDDFKTWLAENPTTVLYQLANPVETSLTDAEVQAFRALHSNKPTTTVLNDAGAHMVLEYAADPKTFITNQIAAAIAANN